MQIGIIDPKYLVQQIGLSSKQISKKHKNAINTNGYNDMKWAPQFEVSKIWNQKNP